MEVILFTVATMNGVILFTVATMSGVILFTVATMSGSNTLHCSYNEWK